VNLAHLEASEIRERVKYEIDYVAEKRRAITERKKGKTIV
jgi:hypothetical protein